MTAGVEAAAQEPKKYPLKWRDIKMICEKVNVPYGAMILLLHHENGYVGLARKNTNGSYDYGPFQVNSVHLNAPIFQQAGITAEALRYNGKINALAAAYLFKKALQKAKTDMGRTSWADHKLLFAAIGNYHSRTPHVRAKYQRDFTKRMKSFRKKGVAYVLAQANRYPTEVNSKSK